MRNGADPEQVARQRQQREGREADQKRQIQEQALLQQTQREGAEKRQQEQQLQQIIREATE